MRKKSNMLSTVVAQPLTFTARRCREWHHRDSLAIHGDGGHLTTVNEEHLWQYLAPSNAQQLTFQDPSWGPKGNILLLQKNMWSWRWWSCSKWWFLSRLRCFFTGGCSGLKGNCICICLVWISVGVEPMVSKMVGTSENCGTSKTDKTDKMDGLNRKSENSHQGLWCWPVLYIFLYAMRINA